MFFMFFGSPRRATEKIPKIPPQSLPRALWGPPREPEIDQLCASGGARRPTNNLFWLPGPPPGAIWSLPGGRLGPTWRPEAPRRAPGLHFRPSGASLGSIFLRFSCFSHGFLHVILRRLVCVVVFVLVCAPFFSQPSSEKHKG